MREQLLKDQIAIITGGTNGIGRAIAECFAKEGAKVLLLATSLERGEKAVEEIISATQPGQAEFFQVDVSDTPRVKEIIDAIGEKYGRIDILVNNAGITKDGLFMRMKDEDFESVMNVNLTSVFVLSRAVIKGMFKRRSGRIINISSVVGTMGNPGQANYCASKGGLVAMTKSIAIEAASRGITANCIAPGFIETAMTNKLNDEQKARITTNIPAGKMGTPADIAAAAVYLASNEAAYVTGQTIHINGGLLMV